LWRTLDVPAQEPAYYAVSGGINPLELTIIGFGTFEIEGHPDRLDRVTIDLPEVDGPGTIALGADAQATYTTTTEQLAHLGESCRARWLAQQRSRSLSRLFRGTLALRSFLLWIH
jgi:hypothetical protein